MINQAINELSNDNTWQDELSKSPIKKATFYAIKTYIKAGNKLNDLPWFSYFNIKKYE
jgi:hypothetical protein